jgi:CRISPR-associated endonuclease/helicase Cas3
MTQTAALAADLSLPDFGRFFEEVHGYRPFPWQEALVTRVLDRGWPALIDVPTGLGKTAVLDVAVFVNALRSEHGRRRVFLVVDRRLIVDQAHEQALKIQKALENPPAGSVRERVRARLAVPGDEAPALDVTRMRGGVDWSWLWIERPDRHAVVTGTVDQVGSRLLFRGYGVGERLRPIDAAMVGSDSLIVVDEAHLSDPFFTTLRDVLAADSGSAGRRPIVVAMSASPQNDDGEAHGITGADVQHTVAGPRLRAPKSLHPVTVSAPASAAAAAVAGALADWARGLGGPGKAVGIVANTVPMARRVFELLRADASGTAGCVLLTGRVRPLDREYLLASWLPRIKSGADRDPEAELYVVATQTIEAGADIDLDAMVTQTASLPALVQRLGRVNRLGNRDEARVVVVHADKLTDPVYGQAAVDTWAWLTSLADPIAHKPQLQRSAQALGAGIDASPAALRELTTNIPRPQWELMQGSQPYVPVISRSVLDAWARTSPAPQPDVPVAPYLHGIDAGEPTACIVWRADLPGGDPAGWLPALNQIPPSADEAIELPVSAVRRWLTQLPSAGPSASKPAANQAAETNVSDLESQHPEGIEQAAEPAAERRSVLAYRGAEDSQTITAQQVRPGDFVAVPAAWGGCDRYGWHPASGSAVTDVADFTGWRGRRPAAIRVGPVLTSAIHEYAPELLEPVGHLISKVTGDIDTESVNNVTYQNLLQEMTAGRSPRLPHEHVLSRLARGGHLLELNRDTQADMAGTPLAGLFVAPGASWNEDQSAAGTSSSPSGEPLTLGGHQAAVGRRARDFACNLGLPEALVLAVERAARHHDEGKRDRRFQVMLHRGDHWRERIAPVLLAKSGMDPADRAAFRRAAALSGYPPKMRHEALSARITRDMLDHEPGTGLDSDLVVHLVAAHHGCARPLLPPIVDEHPEQVKVEVGGGQIAVFDTAETVDWAGPERFGRLCERYGRWGLALLEAIVRLADMWCSARGEECDDHR